MAGAVDCREQRQGGRGIVPVVDEPLMDPESYSADRLFVHLRANGEHDDIVEALKEAGKPF